MREDYDKATIDEQAAIENFLKKHPSQRTPSNDTRATTLGEPSNIESLPSISSSYIERLSLKGNLDAYHPGLEHDTIDHTTYSYDEDDNSIPYSNYTHIDQAYIEEVNITELLASYGITDEDSIREAEARGYNDPEKWDVNFEGDYYGDRISSYSPPAGFADFVKAAYYNQPNATHESGVFEYVRSRGLKTAGYKPAEAMIAFLNAENKRKNTPTALKNVHYIERKRVKLDKIHYKKTRFDKVKSRELQAEFPTVKKTAGVLLRNSDGSYELFDGYHRTKGLFEKHRASGEFFILSK